MSLDASVRKVAQRVMRKVGTAALIRRSAGTYDPATGTVLETTTDTPVRGRLDPVTDRQFSDTVKVGDRWFTVAAVDLSFTPTPSEKVLIAGESFTIVSPGGVRQEMVQDQPALYVLQLRR